ncbi:MAG: mechanosensitive ion channel family protein [bacterium]|nr:mechanosensitive ion channel family protein [bacterium]
MGLKRYGLIILIIIAIPLAVYGNKNAGETGKINKIVFLPFYNYSQSEMNYLATYIPELIMKDIAPQKQLELLRIKKPKLKGEELYEKDSVQKFLKSKKADIGIMGRYITHGTVIVIDYKVVYANTGQVKAGKSFEGLIDDKFIDSLNRFARNSSKWIKKNFLGEAGLSLVDKEINIFKKFAHGMKNSWIGFIVNNKWVFSGIIFLFFYIMARIVAVFFDKVLKKLALKTETQVDDKIVAASKKPVKWIFIFIGLKMAVVSLGTLPGIGIILDNLLIAIIVILIIYILIKSSDIMIHSWGKKLASRIDERIDDDLVPLFVNIARFIILSLGVIILLSRFEIDIAPLIASLGIVGFAIGFAVKDSLANMIGGIVLSLDHSIAVGDKVTIDEDTGIITEVGLRNTKLITYDNEIIVIPNGELVNKKFKNYALPDTTIRVVVNFSVAYGSNMNTVEKVVLSALRKIDNICDDPAPVVVFETMGEFSLNCQAKVWIPDYSNFYSKWLETTKVVYNALLKGGIDIPFPTHTVYMEEKKEKKEKKTKKK